MADRVVVTGANGFVGRHVVRAIAGSGVPVSGLVRSAAATERVEEAGGTPLHVEALDEPVLAAAFEGARAVVHLAHIGAERSGASYDAVNVTGTEAVVGACRSVGVARVVLLSGLGVAHYGIRPRCTNPYFLSKLAAEIAVFRSGLEATVFRPSYILGPGSALVADLRAQIETGAVDIVGSGRQRLQPIAVADAAALVGRVASAPPATARRPPHQVFDLVGPEAVSFRDFVARLARADQVGRWITFREVAEPEADRQAAAGGYRGMLPDELDCLVCDEIGDPDPLERLLGRPLTPLDAMLANSR